LDPKRGSHPCFPFGPYDGPGGQHGPLRWVDWNLERMSSDAICAEVSLPDLGFNAERHFVIGDNDGYNDGNNRRLMVTSSVENTGTEPLHTSMAEHFYFALPGGLTEETVSHLYANGQSLVDLFPDFGHGILNGQSFFLAGGGKKDGYTSARFDLPDGKELFLLASSYVEGIGSPLSEEVGFVIWHFQGSESICIEPVVGARQQKDGQLDCTGLHIPVGRKANLATSISVK